MFPDEEGQGAIAARLVADGRQTRRGKKKQEEKHGAGSFPIRSRQRRQN